MIDLTDLVKQLQEEEEEAQRALHVAQLRLANIRGQKRGLERTVELINGQMQPVHSNGIEQPA